jgi:MoaA/NifB/PqqE/SkfB family radical SAM enzyme
MNDLQRWFKQQLRLIEIELFSYCNRRCWYCPNSYIDRLSQNQDLPEALYLKILDQLASIEYSQEITYSRYNEPLAYRDLFLRSVSQARQLLPNAKLRTNTNGDFLTSSYLADLRTAGLNELFIQQYLGNAERYDHSMMSSAMHRTIERLEVTAELLTEECGQRIEWKLDVPGMKVHLRARNFAVEGSGRTSEVKDDSYVRTKACVQPFHNMYIDYNGSVMVCCNTRSDMAEHAEGVMGSVHHTPLWEIFAGPAYARWREHLKADGPKSGVCKSCKIDLDWKQFVT